MTRLSLLPQSLVGRIFALYSMAMVLFACGGLVLFSRYQFRLELSNAQLRADALVAVVAPIVSDNAVIGDYDMIRHTLENAIRQPDFASAFFIDLRGGVVKTANIQQPDVSPPAWLTDFVARRLYDTNQPIVVAGRDYGLLRFSFDSQWIAGNLWGRARAAFVLVALSIAAGLLLIWLPLKGWLGNLGQIHSFEEGMRSGTVQVQASLAAGAPIEFKRTFDVLSRAAANLQVQREQAAVTLAAIADGVFTLDATGCVVLVNPAACDALVLPAHAVLGRLAHDLLPELFAGGVPAAYVPWRGRRASIVASDATRRVLDTTLSSITGADGLLCGHVLACRDVSEQHALDQRLQEELRSRQTALAALRGLLEGLMPQAVGSYASNGGDVEAISQMISTLVLRMQKHSEQLSAIFALSPDGFVSFDPQRTVNYISPAFTRLTGLDDSEVLGLDEVQFTAQLGSRCVDGNMPGFACLHKAAQDPGRDGTRRHLMNIERPTRRTLEVTLRPGDGTTISQVLYLRDVTYETEVEQLKSEFLSTAAHELRTPMTSIYGFSELMMHRQLAPARQTEVIAAVHRQTGVMISIVNELLDLARIEARRGRDFVIEPVDLWPLVAEVVHDFHPSNERAPPEMALPRAAVLVRVDRGKLAQALGNVFSNAYKYSPEGGAVRITMRHDEAAPGKVQRVGVAVSDTGIGMTPQQLSRVSERFYRADTSGSIPGTGLGMSIVKEIIELLGGSLEVTSAPGEGTQVTLWLPVAHAAGATAGSTLADPPAEAAQDTRTM